MAVEIQQLKSYVWHHATGQCFFVSTNERDSSAATQPPVPRYMETLVWLVEWETDRRGPIVVQVAGGPAFNQHFEVCRQLWQTGKYVEAEEP